MEASKVEVVELATFDDTQIEKFWILYLYCNIY